jgi:transposase
MDALPDDVDILKQIILAERGELVAAKAGLAVKTLEVEKLKIQLARLQRMSFGQSSERMRRETGQLELRLEELETAEAIEVAPTEVQSSPEEAPEAPTPQKKKRRDFPAQLPRSEVVHEPAQTCPQCGGAMRKVGEDITEILEYVPGRFEVIRHIRPACSCRKCEAMAQAPMPSLPIPRGQAGPGLLAHVLISKYCDHLPLYRQSQIYARDGIELDRALLACWMGRIAWLTAPLVEAVARHVKASVVIHADDTPVPVLAPGSGKTRQGRQWVYLRDERPHGGGAPPAVFYRYTPDRKGEHPRTELAAFAGFLHADGYAGFNELYELKPGREPIIEVACWAHARRKLFDVHKTTQSQVAAQALERIGALFEIERAINGKPPAERLRVRQARAVPLLDDLARWFDARLEEISGKSDLAGAIRYARSRWEAFTRYTGDGRLEISNNAAERAIRPLTLGRKNWLFAGSDAGGETAASAYTLIESAKLNGLDPEAYLRFVIKRIADHPINRIQELLPWNIGMHPVKAAA